MMPQVIFCDFAQQRSRILNGTRMGLGCYGEALVEQLG
jgi:hypothetical protein